MSVDMKLGDMMRRVEDNIERRCREIRAMAWCVLVISAVSMAVSVTTIIVVLTAAR